MALHAEIVKTLSGLGQSYEIIFIDDGSRDETFLRLTRLTPITVIRFRNNFGQTAALDAGFKYAHGEILITLDGDGQNDPADIPKLLTKLAEGFDMVSGWRFNRQDPNSKILISRGADWLRKYFIDDGTHDSGCTLKVFRRSCVADLNLYGEMHRFIPGILSWQGYRISEVRVNHRSRTTGRTKYNWKRIVKGFIDMISIWFWRKYSDRPLHLFGGLGIVLGGFGFALGLGLGIARALDAISLQNSIWPLISIFAVLGGIQFFISGLLADIAIKTYYNHNRTSYSIREIIENPKPIALP